jgi:regulatory protein YycH of two-component signal transduction system YycFG
MSSFKYLIERYKLDKGGHLMNFIIFRIVETKDGDFVLYVHNHSQKKVVRLLRSKNLDAVVDKLKKVRMNRRAFNRVDNYASVIGVEDRREGKYYVTFRIEETKDGDFVLYVHNHSQKKVFEKLRSKNLDAVVDKLKKERKYRHAFNSAASNYMTDF